jgi:pyruvate dehydrogenase E1 component beta subunit
VPATLEDARHMLAPALADPNPVVIFEHGSLYGVEGDRPDDAGAVDLDHAAIRRPGDDVTIAAYGLCVWTALEAAEQLAGDGIDAEVIDLRVLRPFDAETVMTSVARTNRAVVVDEMWRAGSFAAEVSARIMEDAFYDLDAPVARVCSAEVPMPYAEHLERAAMPQAADVVAAVHEVTRHG